MTKDPELCQRCNGWRYIRVKHGLTFDDDSAAERELAWHNEPCPVCMVAQPSLPDSAESPMRATQEVDLG